MDYMLMDVMKIMVQEHGLAYRLKPAQHEQYVYEAPTFPFLDVPLTNRVTLLILQGLLQSRG